MKLRTKFILFISLIHIALLLVSFLLLKTQYLSFILAELFILLSIGFSIHLYHAFIRPLNMISTGIESMKDKDFNSRFVPVGQYELDQLIDTYNKMIGQLREERIVQEEQHFFLQRLINASPSGIIILDLDDRIMSLNPAAEKLFLPQNASVAGRKLSELSGEMAAGLGELQTGEPRVIKTDGMKSFKCQKSHFVDHGFKRHFILIEELTEQIIRAQRQAYDKVIRMMSHEINNSIGAINSILTSFLTYKTQLKKGDRDDFENALLVSIERNNRLNHFIANFAEVVRIPPPLKTTCDLHQILRNIQVVMSARFEEKNITWKWNLSDVPLNIDADAQQMEQVIVNILKNAIEAIGTNGEVTIGTTTASIKMLRITDNGKGFTPDIRKNLFAPFFSTKPTGQGIGLTLTREILVNHGFPFTLERNTNGYTEFRIEFPSPPA